MGARTLVEKLALIASRSKAWRAGVAVSVVSTQSWIQSPCAGQRTTTAGWWPASPAARNLPFGEKATHLTGLLFGVVKYAACWLAAGFTSTTTAPAVYATSPVSGLVDSDPLSWEVVPMTRLSVICKQRHRSELLQ